MSSLRFLSALALLAAPAIVHAQQPTPRQSQSSLESFFRRRSLMPTIADTVAPRATTSTCPMVVVRPDTTRLERMPRARVDTTKMAPMPVAHGCGADAK